MHRKSGSNMFPGFTPALVVMFLVLFAVIYVVYKSSKITEFDI